MPWSFDHRFFPSRHGHLASSGHEFVCLMVVSTSTTGSNSCSQVPNGFQNPNLPVELGFWMVKIFPLLVSNLPTKPLH